MDNKVQIENVRVKGSEFTGIAYLMGKEVEIYGEFGLAFDDDMPMIAHIDISVNGDDLTAAISEMLFDLDTLQDDILAFDDGSWYSEHVEAMLEHRREMMEDR